MSLLKNIVVLMTGTVVSQLIILVSSPLITHIYSPDNLGKFAIYFSIASIISIISTGKYEEAIPLPKSDFRALLLTLASISLNIAITIIYLFVFNLAVCIFPSFFSSFSLGRLEINLICIASLLLSIGNIFVYWFIRNHKFNNISQNKIVQSTSNVTLSIILGYFIKTFGLIISDLLSRFFSALSFFLKFKEDKNFIKFFNFSSSKIKFSLLVSQLKIYINYPKYIVPGSLMNVLARQLPIIVMTFYLTPHISGLMMMSQRIILGPLGIITESLSKAVLSPMANQLRINGECWNLYKKGLIYLALIPLPILVLGFVFFDSIVKIFFGNEWRELTHVVFIFSPYFYLNLVSSPLSIIYIAAGKQRVSLFMQTLFLITTSLSLGIILLFNLNEFQSLWILSISYSLYYICSLIVSALLAKGFFN